MLKPLDRRHERSEAAARVKQWTRERFAPGGDMTILVTELESAVPGFPPLHTVVAFWTERQHYHFRVFKPLQEVEGRDVPPAWYREALRVTPGTDCGCC